MKTKQPKNPALSMVAHNLDNIKQELDLLIRSVKSNEHAKRIKSVRKAIDQL